MVKRKGKNYMMSSQAFGHVKLSRSLNPGPVNTSSL